MRFLIFVFLIYISSLSILTGQRNEPVFKQVEIDLTTRSLSELGKVGIDVTHGRYIKNESFTATLGDWELERIVNAGFTFRVNIADAQKHYLERNKEHIQTRGLDSLACQLSKLNYPTPINFELGSMGGFITYDQMKDHLEAMFFSYPHLISSTESISNIKTHQGNEILYVKISDNPNVDENEPEILYTALHHAREPISLSQMIFYMWYLLENYNTNAEIRDIVNETEMFFIPCINPDGYIMNNETHPNGGGMWRKNLRDNNNDGDFHIETDGVDINRNYGFKWGFDNVGSSADSETEIYRGLSAFSEPENQAIRSFLSSRNFEFAFNYHSHGNVLLYPWGYADVDNDKREVYDAFSEILTAENNYIPGTSKTALDYFTNGDANDWMFGDDNIKPSIVTFTPEVGDTEDGFYPAEANIIKLCKQTMGMNIMLAKLVHSFSLVVDRSNTTTLNSLNDLSISIKNFSTQSANFEVTIHPITEFISEYSSAPQIVSLSSLESQEIQFNFTLAEATPTGTRVGFEVQAYNGAIIERDTIYKVYSPNGDFVYENGFSADNWLRPSGSTWNTTNEVAFEGNASFTDSPNGNYEKNEISIMQLKQEIDLTKAEDAYIEFWTKWYFDDFGDHVVIQASINNGVWENLCGQLSREGNIFQDYKEPVYNQTREEWAKEYISLKDLKGNKVKIRFVLFSDGFLERDGFYFDEFIVGVLEKNSVSYETIEKDGLVFEPVRPNPANNITYVPITILPNHNIDQGTVIIRDALGRVVIRKNLESTIGKQMVRLEISHLATGPYFISLQTQNGIIATQTLIVK